MSAHEPECLADDPAQQTRQPCICDDVQAAFTRGYNAGLRTAAYRAGAA